MYYFDIIEILEKQEQGMTAFNIFLELRLKKECSYISLQKMLYKMSMKNPKVQRVTNKGRQYLYYYLR
jgi:hypothetical protein